MEQDMTDVIETAVTAAIEAVAGLAGKVYPLNAPEGVPLPYVVYVSGGTTEDDSLSGWIGSFDTEMEINVLHQSYKGMKTLARKVVEALKGTRGAAVHIREEQPELYEEEIGAYRKIIELRLQH